MDKICCDKEMTITYPPWGTLAGFFHPKFYSECKGCGKKYFYTWGHASDEDGQILFWSSYHRREISEEEIKRRTERGIV